MTEEELYGRVTERQRTILRLLLRGIATDKDLSAATGLTRYAITRIVSELFSLTDTHTRVALVIFVLRRPKFTALLSNGKPRQQAGAPLKPAPNGP